MPSRDRSGALEHVRRIWRLLADFYQPLRQRPTTSPPQKRLRSQIGHVQIADAPGRGEREPANPAPDLPRQVAEQGYRGYVGLEYKATRPDTFEWIPRAERGATTQPQAETRI